MTQNKELCAAATGASCGECVLPYVTESEWDRSIRSGTQPSKLGFALLNALKDRKAPEPTSTRQEKIAHSDSETERALSALNASALDIPESHTSRHTVVMALDDCMWRFMSGVCEYRKEI